MKRNQIFSILIASFYVLLFTNCGNDNTIEKTKEQLIRDTLKRPTSVSNHSKLLNFGTSDDPRMAWYEYLGNYRYKAKNYEHIFEIKLTEPSGTSSIYYYENLSIRASNKPLNFGEYDIIKSWSEGGDIEAVKGKDTINLFPVLQGKEFDEVYNGLKITRLFSIIKNQGRMIYGGEMQYNLQEQKNGFYVLTSRESNIKICYKLHTNGIETPSIVSFLNREDGRIYFIEKSCYLELVDKIDLPKLKNWD